MAMMDPKTELLEIWGLAGRLADKLDRLDKIDVNRRSEKYAAIQSAQNSFRDWRGINLGELMNLFDLPPEKRNGDEK